MNEHHKTNQEGRDEDCYKHGYSCPSRVIIVQESVNRFVEVALLKEGPESCGCHIWFAG